MWVDTKVLFMWLQGQWRVCWTICLSLGSRYDVELVYTLLPSMMFLATADVLGFSCPLTPPCRQLHDNGLTGSIPGTLSTLQNLKLVYVSCSSCAQASSLKQLLCPWGHGGMLSRLILACRSMIFHAEHQVVASISSPYPLTPPCRDISRNALTGSIPGTLSALTNLWFLYVHCSVYAP